MSQLRSTIKWLSHKELDYMLSRHGSSAVIKFNHDSNNGTPPFELSCESNEVVVLSKDGRATPGGLWLLTELTTIPMPMATTTSTTITGVWSE